MNFFRRFKNIIKKIIQKQFQENYKNVKPFIVDDFVTEYRYEIFREYVNNEIQTLKRNYELSNLVSEFRNVLNKVQHLESRLIQSENNIDTLFKNSKTRKTKTAKFKPRKVK